MPHGHHKQHRSDGVEKNALDDALGFAEGHHGPPLGQLVDHHGPVEPLRHDCGEVVTPGMPGDGKKDDLGGGMG